MPQHYATSRPMILRPTHRRVLAVLLTLAWLLALPGRAPAADDPLILPPGQVLQVLGAAQENQELIDQGRATPTTLPFEQGTSVYEVRTTALTYYVRFYQYDPSRLRGGGVGGWIMPADSVRGLTMEQVRDKFALPTVPDYYIAVRVPTGVTIRTGTAGPIAGWGDGGGQQYLLMEYISLDDYRADRPARGAALAYAPYVGGGNALAVAGYLDGLATPARYSDLDIVLGNLNLQYNADLAVSMRRIGPQAYDALTRISQQQSLAALNGMSAHRREMMLRARSGEAREGAWLPWARVFGQRGDFRDSAESTGFGYDAAGIGGGVNRLCGSVLWGLNVFYSRADFDWAQGGGDGDAENLNFGLEALGDRGGWFWEAAVLAGARQAQANRALRFEDIDRTARGGPEGWNLAGHIAAGLDYGLLGWAVRPAAGLYLLHTHQDGFSETGADSLNLKLEDVDASSLTGRLELRLCRVFELGRGLRLRPELTLAWQHECPLDDRDIDASLAASGGRFTVHGYDEDTDAFAPSLELAAATEGGVVFYLRYDGQLADQYTVNELRAGLSMPF